ncbi:response regulator [Salidesulfovibrio brasiliensis]|uniref:response regulator n=1 Tax=Salidesulfovibrio brasiliensis TaxID=221711 RepID=UPI0009FA5109|nr:response regulator [Salidesulfovibrio brasiliensis]
MKLQICIVDDDVYSANALWRILSQVYSVRCFYDPREFLKYSMDNRRIFCCIVDYRMPNINGLDLFIKAKEHCSIENKILVTGYPDVELPAAKLSGAELDQVLIKPFSTKWLMKYLQRQSRKMIKQNTRVVLTADELRALNQGFEELKDAGFSI